MSNINKWTDDYWLPLIQLYLRKPVGVKPLYSRALVDLSLELHLPPHTLQKQLQRLRLLNNPVIEKLWNRYSTHPKQLAAAVDKWRRMRGFGLADTFYEGVERQQQDFETDFLPVEGLPHMKPVMLILVLHLYYQLTPNTMVEDTPEVKTLAKKIHLNTKDIVSILDTYQQCDPYLNKREEEKEEREKRNTPLYTACQNIWQRYEMLADGQIEADAVQMAAYFE